MSRLLLNAVLTMLFFSYVDGFCKFPEYFHCCGKLKEPTCTNPVLAGELRWDECLSNGPGCRCIDGYVRNLHTKTCMPKYKCAGVAIVNVVRKTADAFLTSLINHNSCHKCK